MEFTQIAHLLMICAQCEQLLCKEFLERDWLGLTCKSKRSLDQVRGQTSCVICRLVTRLYDASEPYLSDQDKTPLVEGLYLCLDPTRLNVILDSVTLGSIRISSEGDEHVAHNGYLSEVRKVDSGQLRLWIGECRYNHDHPLRHCHKRYQTPIDVTLIDVQSQCLVKLSTRVDYLALSYVWGKENSLMSTAANQQSLQEPGSLYNLQKSIGRLILDAMELVHQIGERYLW